MKKNYTELLKNILTKEGAFGELKQKFRSIVTVKKQPLKEPPSK